VTDRGNVMEILRAITVAAIWATELLGFAVLWWRWRCAQHRDR
jgi:hypothetical protein